MPLLVDWISTLALAWGELVPIPTFWAVREIVETKHPIREEKIVRIMAVGLWFKIFHAEYWYRRVLPQSIYSWKTLRYVWHMVILGVGKFAVQVKFKTAESSLVVLHTMFLCFNLQLKPFDDAMQFPLPYSGVNSSSQVLACSPLNVFPPVFADSNG
jgi:hypothetical protein